MYIKKPEKPACIMGGGGGGGGGFVSVKSAFDWHSYG